MQTKENFDPSFLNGSVRRYRDKSDKDGCIKGLTVNEYIHDGRCVGYVMTEHNGWKKTFESSTKFSIEIILTGYGLQLGPIVYCDNKCRLWTTELIQ